MNTVHLSGAEDVRSAGCAMQHAGEAMQQAADSFDDALERNRRWMEEWLSRFEAAIEKADPFAPAVEPKAAGSVCPEAPATPRRMMQADPTEPVGTYHSQEHAEVDGCRSSHYPCQPVEPPPATTRRMKANTGFSVDLGEHSIEHDENPDCRFPPTCQPVDPPKPAFDPSFAPPGCVAKLSEDDRYCKHCYFKEKPVCPDTCLHWVRPDGQEVFFVKLNMP